MSGADSTSKDNIVQAVKQYTLEGPEAELSKKKASFSPEFPAAGTLGRLILL